MSGPVAGNRPQLAVLPPGLGAAFRRELLLRTLFASVLAAVFLGAVFYGGIGVSDDVDLGVPFVVFGIVGALVQAVLITAMVRARAAIHGDSYRMAAVIWARRFAKVSLSVLAIGAVIALFGTLALGGGLAGFTGLGLFAVVGTGAHPWAALSRLVSHANSAHRTQS